MLLRNPRWIDPDLASATRVEDVPDSKFKEIRERLASKISPAPLVSIVIAAWNEEMNIIRTLNCLSHNVSEFPFEIIVVNNNSKDRTQEVIDKLGVKSMFQVIQGCGPARDMGQREAKGKYILLADGDSFYPPTWISHMTRELMKPGTVCVYGKHSFLGTSENPRWQFFIYEMLRNVITEFRELRRPYINALGMSMGYIREYGVKEGYVGHNVRGDDGRLAFDLMKYGKIRLIRAERSRVWTINRTLGKDGGLWAAFKRRFFRELAHVDQYVQAPKAHDTKTSESPDFTVEESLDALKSKYTPAKIFRKKK